MLTFGVIIIIIVTEMPRLCRLRGSHNITVVFKIILLQRALGGLWKIELQTFHFRVHR